MDPKACFLAYLNAPRDEAHLYYEDLCAWFQRGGCGFGAVWVSPKGARKACRVTRLTFTRDAHITFRNGRKRIVRESEIEVA